MADDTTLTEDARSSLELSAEENADLCTGCSRCCETVSIEVDAPRSPWEYDQWIWVLHHRNLELYVEKPERWYLHIEAQCEQLGDDRRCKIYGSHPVLCREYDPRDCERRAPLSDIVAWFKTAADLEQWLAVRRPTHWKRLIEHRAQSAQGPPVADARADARRAIASALIQVGEPAAKRAAHEPGTRLPLPSARERRRKATPAAVE